MAQKKSHRSKIRRMAATATAATAAAAVMAVPGTAHAEPFLNATYPFTGTSHIASVDSDMDLGPGTMTSRLDFATGQATASVDLPPAQGDFNAIGFIPTTATVSFVEEGQSTAQLDPTDGSISATARMTIKISNVKVLGIPLLVGSHCQTEEPAQINLESGQGWHILVGGPLSGTYSIPDFENCLLGTAILNALIPGGGNTITLNLGRPTVSQE
jgi:hypothetical protein